MDSITWACHICKRVRPNDAISVHQTDVSLVNDLPLGTMKHNVRYCNDNQDCIDAAKAYSHFSKE